MRRELHRKQIMWSEADIDLTALQKKVWEIYPALHHSIFGISIKVSLQTTTVNTAVYVGMHVLMQQYLYSNGDADGVTWRTCQVKNEEVRRILEYL